MTSPSARSPRLPWEVIERIIGYPCNRKTISNFSLTCRELRPRSLCLLVSDVTFYDRNKIFDFCDLLKAKPHLKPLVRSILVYPDDFSPVPLLRMLPNLSEIKFKKTALDSDGYYGYYDLDVLNQPTLTSCQIRSAHIQSLSLSALCFATSIQFLRVLSMFPSIIHLVCSDVYIDKEKEPAPPSRGLDVVKRRLAQKLLHLRTLAIIYERQTLKRGLAENLSVTMLLLESELVQSTIESLTLEGVHRSTKQALQQFNWPRLQSLALKLWFGRSEYITSSIAFLNGFHHLILKEVSVEIHEPVIMDDHPTRQADLFEELERTLLKFPQVQLVLVVDVLKFPIGENSSRVQEVENRFPALLQSGALTVVPNTALRTGHAHGAIILTVSRDSKWVASMSGDDTIAHWDTANGALVQRWLPHDYSGNMSLAFSPNGQFLASATSNHSNLVIWDLREDHDLVHQELKGPSSSSHMSMCAWSPLGDIIASASRVNGYSDNRATASVCLWDANTFQSLHVLQHSHTNPIVFLSFSPDGHWILTGQNPSSYYIWDVASGTGQQLCPNPQAHYVPDDATIIGAFNSTSTRCAIVLSKPAEGTVKIVDINGERGEVFLDCGTGEPGWKMEHLAFSPDGNLVLTVPRHWRSSSGTVKIWNAYTGIELLSLEGHTNRIWTACFSPCGKYIASASDDHTVRLWRTSDGSCVATLSDYESRVFRVIFSPDGKTLISGAYDGSVIIRQMCDVLPIDEQDP